MIPPINQTYLNMFISCSKTEEELNRDKIYENLKKRGISKEEIQDLNKDTRTLILLHCTPDGTSGAVQKLLDSGLTLMDLIAATDLQAILENTSDILNLISLDKMIKTSILFDLRTYVENNRDTKDKFEGTKVYVYNYRLGDEESTSLSVKNLLKLPRDVIFSIKQNYLLIKEFRSYGGDIEKLLAFELHDQILIFNNLQILTRLDEEMLSFSQQLKIMNIIGVAAFVRNAEEFGNVTIKLRENELIWQIFSEVEFVAKNVEKISQFLDRNIDLFDILELADEYKELIFANIETITLILDSGETLKSIAAMPLEILKIALINYSYKDEIIEISKKMPGYEKQISELINQSCSFSLIQASLSLTIDDSDSENEPDSQTLLIEYNLGLCKDYQARLNLMVDIGISPLNVMILLQNSEYLFNDLEDISNIIKHENKETIDNIYFLKFIFAHTDFYLKYKQMNAENKYLKHMQNFIVPRNYKAFSKTPKHLFDFALEKPKTFFWMQDVFPNSQLFGFTKDVLDRIYEKRALCNTLLKKGFDYEKVLKAIIPSPPTFKKGDKIK